MHTLIVWAAQYLLWVMGIGFVAVWLWREDRAGKLELAADAVVGVVLMVVFLYVAKSVHHDPRPFVRDPNVKPLFGHSRDDGFPSDHSLASGLIAILVLWRHRLLGLPFVAAAGAIAWARVAAHVHPLQDVVVGLVLGGLAGLIACLVVPAALARRRSSSAGAAVGRDDGRQPVRPPGRTTS
jgi:membrane-associated phospholipid phosphatase